MQYPEVVIYANGPEIFLFVWLSAKKQQVTFTKEFDESKNCESSCDFAIIQL